MAQNALYILKNKLKEFVKKYYLNEVIKGLLVSFSVILVYFLFAILVNHYTTLNTTARKLLFFLLVLISIVFLSVYVLKPLFKYFGFLKPISEYEAAKIIGNYFSNVQDKLLNTLQLSNLNDNTIDVDLLQAGINQKINELKPIPFTKAVDFKENKKYLYLFSIPFLLFLFIWVASPNIVNDGSKKLINYNKEFLPKAPFDFNLINDNLQAVKGEPFTVKLTLNGKTLPKNVYVIINGVKHLMSKNNNGEWVYTINATNKNFTFQFYAGGFFSKTYAVDVFAKPVIQKFSVAFEYPSYLKMPNKTLDNIGNFTLPEGTTIRWKIYTENTKNLTFIINDSVLNTEQVDENVFEAVFTPFKSTSYKIVVANNKIKNKDTLSFFIDVIKDQYPTINVQAVVDTISFKNIYCKVNINDDYGFSSLKLFIKSEKAQKYSQIPLNIIFNQPEQQLYYTIQVDSFLLPEDEKLNYYFQVWDNDKIHGYKSAKTYTNQYKKPGFSELSEKTDKNNQAIKDNLNKALDEVKQLKKEIAELKKSLFEKEKPDWQDQKKIQQLMEKEKQLEKMLNQTSDINKQNNFRQNDENISQEILQKQQMLNELFDKVMTEEMKKMYEELQKMLEQLNKSELEKELEKTELTNEELEKELDRSIELFKQLEVEQKAEQLQNELQKLAEKQEQLADKTSKSDKKDAQQLKEEQDKINKQFEDIKKQLSDLEKLNNELENKKDLGIDEQKKQNISNELQKASETLNSNKPKKASENQKNAADDMKEMAQQMQNSMSDGKQQAEDMEALKQILKNLIESSFQQEDLMKRIEKTSTNDPNFVKLTQEQKLIQENTRIIKDSLYALSKRVFQISHIINKELTNLDYNLEKSLYYLAERQKPIAAAKQQAAMTSYNNLALLLDEALQQMQKQMQQQSGKGSCKKPGGNSPKPASASDIKKMQEQMAKQLEGLKKALEGKNKPGQNPGKLPGKMSKQMAQMAAQQAAIRQKLQELQNQLDNGKNGSGAKKLKEISDLMEQTEKDIVNNNITNETLKRQQEILTRLLESEKAEREQDKDNKRKSETAKNIEHLPDNYLDKYFSKQKKQIEYLKTINPNYQLYYKKKVGNYFLNLTKSYE
jgi:hypothetical protein